MRRFIKYSALAGSSMQSHIPFLAFPFLLSIRQMQREKGKRMKWSIYAS